MRTLTDLTHTDDPAWPLVQQWVADAPSVQVLSAERTRAEEALLQLQVTLRSPMGAVVYHTGGLLPTSWRGPCRRDSASSTVTFAGRTGRTRWRH